MEKPEIRFSGPWARDAALRAQAAKSIIDEEAETAEEVAEVVEDEREEDG